MSTNTTFNPTTALDEFDYTGFVLRTDSAYPVLDPVEVTAHIPKEQAIIDSNPTDVLACIVGIWTQFSIPTCAIAVMSGVLHGLLTSFTGDDGLYEADDAHLLSFVTENPTAGGRPTPEEMRLRRNTINAAYFALEDAGITDTAPLLDVPQLAADLRANQRGTTKGSAATKRVRRDHDQQVHVRPATHDEMLLVRLATRLVGTSRGKHRAAAAVALCSSTATTSEAPQVLWGALSNHTIELSGRQNSAGNNEADIAARQVTLDPWADCALQSWREEQSLFRTLDPHTPMVYDGRQALTSNSAQVCVDNQIGKALSRAGLDQITGLSAGSLRLWGAVNDATDAPSIRAGAHRAGVRFATLHRLVHQLGERAF